MIEKSGVSERKIESEWADKNRYYILILATKKKKKKREAIVTAIKAPFSRYIISNDGNQVRQVPKLTSSAELLLREIFVRQGFG